MQKITLLGATGSIGKNTLSILALHPDRYSLFAITANSDVQSLFDLCQQWHPKFAVLAEYRAAEQLEAKIREWGLSTTVLAGEEGLVRVSSHPECDTVVAAVVGAAGLIPTLAAARAGKRICLANKEALVMGGQLLMQAIETAGATIIPVDSEHNALFQAMPPGYRTGFTPEGVTRLILTASGGPFRELPLEQFPHITPAQAVAHPNWSMGAKVSVDSASMMNKGLELIEAHWLFQMPPSQIEVVIHPQSIVHSLVEYSDGSQLAQLGMPDMRTPIACALSWPERIDSGVSKLNLTQVGHLTFQAPDLARFPCLGLAFEAIKQGGAAPAILNAANEVAVDAFLQGSIPFIAIPLLIEQALNRLSFASSIESVEGLLDIDDQTRQFVKENLASQVS